MSSAVSLLSTLAVLRWFAVAGECVVVHVALQVLDLPFAPMPLWIGIAVLAIGNIALRLWPGALVDRGPVRAVAHLGFDLGLLAWQVAHSGGLSNPFVSLFLLPVALAALFLPRRSMFAVAALALIGFAASVDLAVPMPHAHHGDTFQLHLAGMVASFLLSLLVLVVFMDRLAGQLRARDAELQAARDRAIRHEGILDLATHAASLAHELNTPLAAMTLILDDLQDEAAAGALRADLTQLSALTARCRDRVQSLSRRAEQRDQAQPLRALVERTLTAWALLRPRMLLDRDLHWRGDDARLVDAALARLLLVLLDNAADASEARGSERVAVALAVHDDHLQIAVDDEGDGIPAHGSGLGESFGSSKHGGLGIGLALARASVDARGGSLQAIARDPFGTRMLLRWPLQATSS